MTGRRGPERQIRRTRDLGPAPSGRSALVPATRARQTRVHDRQQDHQSGSRRITRQPTCVRVGVGGGRSSRQWSGARDCFHRRLQDRGVPHAADAELAAEALAQATMRGIEGPAGVPVSYHVVRGEPADVLVRESRASELLVMGSHGVQGLLHSALGSVADTCARMAECPVVIVPTHRARGVDMREVSDIANAEAVPVTRSDAE